MSYIYFHRDYNDFLDDLEEDQTIRENVNIYKGKTAYNFFFHCSLDACVQISSPEMAVDCGQRATLTN